MLFKKSTKVVQHGNNPTIRSPTVLLTTQATTDHLHVPHRTEYLPRNEHLSVFGASKPVLRTLWLQSNRISPRWKRSEFSVPLRVPREALIDGFEKILKIQSFPLLWKACQLLKLIVRQADAGFQTIVMSLCQDPFHAQSRV